MRPHSMMASRRSNSVEEAGKFNMPKIIMPLNPLLDSPVFCRYKNGMKLLRILLGLWLATAILACSALPDLPTIPPGWTVTPSLSPTPEATFTPTLIPTPIPAMRASAGDRALFNGDYDAAFLHYSIALQDSPDASIRASAKWGEARIYFAQERYNETLTALQTLITEYPESPHIGQAYFIQGFVYYRLENYQAAANAWQTYLNLRPGLIDAYAQELRGDALFGAKQFAEARAAYQAAIEAPSLSDDITLD
ncbi:MAG: tetratricopeptide repeat protein, partial [Chloroflexi bacterium]|nr:tetratricopeptide repeat protein [Chloroflexota bacterium]